MPGTGVVVKAAFDPEARVWYVETSDVPGLNLEAATVEELCDKLPGAIADLLEEATGKTDREVPIELVAHAHTRVRIRTTA